MPSSIVLDEPLYEPLWVIVVENTGPCVFLAYADDCFYDLSYPAGSREHTKQSPFIIGDGQFAEGTTTATYKDNDVTGADIRDLPPHETTAGVNQQVKAFDR